MFLTGQWGGVLDWFLFYTEGWNVFNFLGLSVIAPSLGLTALNAPSACTCFGSAVNCQLPTGPNLLVLTLSAARIIGDSTVRDFPTNSESVVVGLASCHVLTPHSSRWEALYHE